MSQASVRSPTQEMVISVRLTPALVGELVQVLLRAVRTRPEQADGTAEDPAVPDPDPAPRPESTADPPPPALGAALADTCVLGSVCARGHRYEGTQFSLRRKSNGGCVQCRQHTEAARQGPSNGTGPGSPPMGRNDHQAPGGRPALPGHLRETCFLSPIVCDAGHHYRDTVWSLRFVDSENCVQCLAPTQSLSGTKEESRDRDQRP